MRQFSYLVSTLQGWPDANIPIAAGRCGAIGILNLENVDYCAATQHSIARVLKYRKGKVGIKVDTAAHKYSDAVIQELSHGMDYVVLTADDLGRAREIALLLRPSDTTVLLQVVSREQAMAGIEIGVHGLIAKGNESGGRVGEETTFILLQRLLSQSPLPVWAYGGIGLHTVAGCFAAGAAGVMLDVQVALASESTLAAVAKSAVARMEGDETICLGATINAHYRVYKRPGTAAVDELQRLEEKLSDETCADAEVRWQAEVNARVGWNNIESNVLPLGQDAAFAGSLATQFHTVSGIVAAFRKSVEEHVRTAQLLLPLDKASGLARSHGTQYPILQGPMTRVSDTAAFAAAVAENGALPFLALALMRGPQIKSLLAETKAKLGDKPWGIGILGFVPADLRQEQLDVAMEFRPPFAIIAGGRPDQAAGLERQGTVTYLHVPAPGLLKVFLDHGARRFIFEGRECGGHVGPRSSFVLWEIVPFRCCWTQSLRAFPQRNCISCLRAGFMTRDPLLWSPPWLRLWRRAAPTSGYFSEPAISSPRKRLNARPSWKVFSNRRSRANAPCCWSPGPGT